MTRITRRTFLSTTAAGLLAQVPTSRVLAGANDRVIGAVVGLGRGMAHVSGFLADSNVELRYVCDVDEKRLTNAMKSLEGKEKNRPEKLPTPLRDFRRILDDGDVNVVFIATANHWHAPATILACQAGKHVYVEKPGSHNPQEAEWMVGAARRHGRKVQMGNQRRTWPAIREAIEKLRSGVIGELKYARCWYNNDRPTIGRGEAVTVPTTFDYSLWQGPAPDRPFRSNITPYNWHWFWHWGNGELGNNGIHALDVARWGMGLEYPDRITYLGGRYQFDDDQETPDTGVAQFHFGKQGISWEGSSCHPRRADKLPFVAFYGTRGSLHISGGADYKIFDPQGKETDSGKSEAGETEHIANLLKAIRTDSPLNSEIGEVQKSTLMCHLGNISYRLGRQIEFDSTTQKIKNCPEAAALWTREYRSGWEPKV